MYSSECSPHWATAPVAMSKVVKSLDTNSEQSSQKIKRAFTADRWSTEEPNEETSSHALVDVEVIDADDAFDEHGPKQTLN